MAVDIGIHQGSSEVKNVFFAYNYIQVGSRMVNLETLQVKDRRHVGHQESIMIVEADIIMCNR